MWPHPIWIGRQRLFLGSAARHQDGPALSDEGLGPKRVAVGGHEATLKGGFLAALVPIDTNGDPSLGIHPAPIHAWSRKRGR